MTRSGQITDWNHPETARFRLPFYKRWWVCGLIHPHLEEKSVDFICRGAPLKAEKAHEARRVVADTTGQISPESSKMFVLS